MTTRRRFAHLRVVAALLSLALAGTALAGKPKIPPTIDQILGQYRVSAKYLEYTTGATEVEKGSYKSLFTITKIGPDQVQVLWESPWGSWTYQGHFRKGVVLAAEGDHTHDPSLAMEMLVLVLSGTPGKLKISGVYMEDIWTGKYVDSEVIKGKQAS